MLKPKRKTLYPLIKTSHHNMNVEKEKTKAPPRTIASPYANDTLDMPGCVLERNSTSVPALSAAFGSFGYPIPSFKIGVILSLHNSNANFCSNSNVHNWVAKLEKHIWCLLFRKIVERLVCVS